MSGYLQDQLWIQPIPSVYTCNQLAEYLSVIGVSPVEGFSLPEGLLTAIAEGDRSAGRLDALERIVKHHLVAFPFENTAIHYTAEREMDVSFQGLFKRLVLERKGSYCFGQNTLLLGMLRALGYRAYSGAARVNQKWQSASARPEYTSQTHMVIFVQPFEDDNRTYIVDVGFGGSGLVRPIPLVDGEASVVMGVGPTEFHRLVKGPFPHSSLGKSANGHGGPISGQDAWNLEVLHVSRAGVESPWLRMYTFSEQEFFPTDCEDASYVVSNAMKLFTENVFCIRYVWDEESIDGHLYRITLFGSEVKANKNGLTRTLATPKTELDRLKVLREVFRIDYPDSAAEYVGRLAQLK